MPNFTPNLNLEKPLGTEFYDVEVNNSNMDKIDTSVKDNSNAINEHQNEIANATQLGHVKGGGNVTISPDGTINTRTASTEENGVVQLNNTLTSNSTTQAATPSTVKTVYDLTVDLENKVDSNFNDLNYNPLVGDLRSLSKPHQVYAYGVTDNRPGASSYYVDAIVRGDSISNRKLIARQYNSSNVYESNSITGAWSNWELTSEGSISNNVYVAVTGVNNLVGNKDSVSLKNFQQFTIKNTTQNTGNVTFNYNSNGAKPVLLNGGGQIPSGFLKSNGIYSLFYDGTNFILFNEGGDEAKYATGTVVVGVDGFATVSGLKFAASKIFCRDTTLPARIFSIYDASQGNNKLLLNDDGAFSFSDNVNGYVNATGFKVAVPRPSRTYTWEIY